MFWLSGWMLLNIFEKIGELLPVYLSYLNTLTFNTGTMNPPFSKLVIEPKLLNIIYRTHKKSNKSKI